MNGRPRQAAPVGAPVQAGLTRPWGLVSVMLVILGIVAMAGWAMRACGTACGPAAVSTAPVARVTPVDRYANATVLATTGAAGPQDAALEAERATAAALRRVDMALQHGSLRGTALDGDWGRWVGPTLQPGLGLRRRFDQLLTAQGELALDDLRRWIEATVAAQHGASGASQVLAVWDAYLALLRSAEPTRFDPDDPASVPAALARRSAQRRAALGLAWAEAFYGEDEQDTAAFMARRAVAQASVAGDAPAPGDAAGQDATALLSPPPTGLDDTHARARDARRVAAFGTEGAARLDAENAAWADWESRLDAARLGLQAIADDAQLSAPQRRQAQQAELARRFEGSERLRAQALLLPAP